MPDITMCRGEGCPMKDTCYRYRATPSEYVQAYFSTTPIIENDCEYYWPIQKGDRLKGFKLDGPEITM